MCKFLLKLLLFFCFLSIFATHKASACDTPACSKEILPITNQVIAIQDGVWTDVAVWNTGVVPVGGKNVVIPPGVTVTYNKNMGATAAAIRSVLVEGTLKFSATVNTNLNVDTIVVMDTGTLEVGNPTTPIASNRVAKITFSGNLIDTTKDIQLKGLGLISHGTTTIHGMIKSSYHKLLGSVSGNVITTDVTPTGWKIGDTVVITGSDYVELPTQTSQVTLDQYETHDEVRTISAITGNTITLNSPLGELRSDGLPKKHEKIHPGMELYVGNLTRNVKFSTITANKDIIARHGHTMFMTSSNVSINYASFVDMGRSDKSYPLTTMFANGTINSAIPPLTIENSTTTATSNMKGRYPIHIHLLGTSYTNPVIIKGNSILNSPGWGLSLHTSYGRIEDNIGFNNFASHFVTEEGNEKGEFIGNLAIKSVGDTVDDSQIQTVGGTPQPLGRMINKGYRSYDQPYLKNGVDTGIVKVFDQGQLGNCFWMQARNVAVQNNIAAGCSKDGFSWFHRNINIIEIPYQDIRNSNREIMSWKKKYNNNQPIMFTNEEVPLTDIDNNTILASHQGFAVVKEDPIAQHNVMTHITGTRAFNVLRGIEFGYTSDYLIEDTKLYAQNMGTSIFDVGLNTNNSLENMIFKDFLISGWEYPMDYTVEFPIGTLNPANMAFTNGTVQLYNSTTTVNFDPSQHIYEFNVRPRVNAYFPDLQQVTTVNPISATLTDIVIPTIPINQSGWWNSWYKVHATLTDSGGIAPSAAPGAGYESYSWASDWKGSAIRARYLEQINGVYVNRTINNLGQPCILVKDHYADRFTKQVYPIDICFPY